MSISSLLSQLVDIFRNWSHDTPEPYVLPAATADTLGGVKVGDGLSVTEDGTLSAQSAERGKFVLSWVPNESSPAGGTMTVDSAPCTPDEFQEALESGQFPWDITVKYPSPYFEDEETITLAYGQSILQGDSSLGIMAEVNFDPSSFSKRKNITLVGLPGSGFAAIAIDIDPPKEPIPRVVVNATMGSSMESMYAIANVSKTPEEVRELFTSGKDFDVVFNVDQDDDVNSVFGSKYYIPDQPSNAIMFCFGWTRVIVNGYATIFETIVMCGYDEDTSSWGDWEILTKLTEIGSLH